MNCFDKMSRKINLFSLRVTKNIISKVIIQKINRTFADVFGSAFAKLTRRKQKEII